VECFYIIDKIEYFFFFKKEKMQRRKFPNNTFDWLRKVSDEHNEAVFYIYYRNHDLPSAKLGNYINSWNRYKKCLIIHNDFYLGGDGVKRFIINGEQISR
jgi:hypothetical protein